MVVGAGRYQSLVWRKGTRTDPIIVRINGEQEFAISYLMNLERLVIRAGENKLAVGGDGDRANRSRVLLDYLRVPFNGVIPQTDGCVR